jgi:hypothetical protein
MLTVSLYRLVTADTASVSSGAALSSARTDEELHQILAGMNDIWSQANIQFEARYVGPLIVPDDVLISIAHQDFDPFFEQVGETFEVPEPALINGFYANNIGGPNGINPYGSRVYFVTDQPSVFDHRVSSHEVGHILGLPHVVTDRDHLLSPGTNGMLLEVQEIETARQFALRLAETE